MCLLTCQVESDSTRATSANSPLVGERLLGLVQDSLVVGAIRNNIRTIVCCATLKKQSQMPIN